MNVPIIANGKGFYYEVKAGKRYLWCSCGRSKSKLFCDGSQDAGIPADKVKFSLRTTRVKGHSRCVPITGNRDPFGTPRSECASAPGLAQVQGPL